MMAVVPGFSVLFGSKFWIPEQKMARKNVSANQNGEGGRREVGVVSAPPPKTVGRVILRYKIAYFDVFFPY